MKRYLLYALVALTFTACKKDPNDSDIPDGPVSTTLTEVTFDKMPATGEPVYGMDMNASGIVACSFGGKLYVSDASGENWTLINDTDYHYKMIFCNDGTLLASTNNGFKRYSTSWVKTDLTAPSLGAAEWTRFGKSNTGVYYLSPNVNNSSATNVYYSTNSGDNWTAIPAPNTGSSYGIYGFGVTADDKLSVVSFQYFARTTNMGQNWTVTTRQFPTAMDGNYVYEASNGNIFLYGMATSNAYLVSTDGGADFTEIDLYNNVGMTSIWEKDGNMYCSLYDYEGRRGAGIYESNDGGASNNWTMKLPCWAANVKTNGNRWVYAEAVNPTFGYMSRRGLGISNDNAATWYTTGPEELPNHIQDFEFDNDGNLLIAMNGALYKRINDKWQLLGAPGGGSSNLNSVTDNPSRNCLTKTPNGDIVYLHGGANNGGGLAAMRLKVNGSIQLLQYIGAVTPQSPVPVTSLGGVTYLNNNDVVFPGSAGALMQMRCIKADMSSSEKVSGSRWVSITGNGSTIYGINDDGDGEYSTDGGVTTLPLTGYPAMPVVFKTTDVYFGYKNFQYYITNTSGSSKAEVTFGQELNPGVILKGKFAPDGKLWLLNEVNPGGVYTLFKTDKPL
jgi:hypothetical protein